MPYIKDEFRHTKIGLVDSDLEKEIESLADYVVAAFSEEDLEGISNYIISVLISRIFLRLKYEGRKYSYKDCNRAIGVLECCKLEFYRRLVATYEEICINKNGDIY